MPLQPKSTSVVKPEKVITPHLSFPKAKQPTKDDAQGIPEGSTKELVAAYHDADDFVYEIQFNNGAAYIFKSPRTPLDNGETQITRDSRLNPQLVHLNRQIRKLWSR